MDNKIIEIPPLPKKIRDAVNNDNLAVFIGAVVSRLLGCWGWDKLAKELVEICFKKEFIQYKERESLLKISDHRQLISIMYNLLLLSQCLIVSVFQSFPQPSKWLRDFL